jgi:hypothetical protein
MGKTVRTMLGREIDMDALLEKHQTMPAVGNVRMNARGDELGPGGKVVKKREDQVAAYYENNPMARPVVKTPAPATSVQPEPTPVAPVVTETKSEKKKGDSNGS